MQTIAPLLRPKNAEAYVHREPFVEVHVSTVSDLINTLLQAQPLHSTTQMSINVHGIRTLKRLRAGECVLLDTRALSQRTREKNGNLSALDTQGRPYPFHAVLLNNIHAIYCKWVAICVKHLLKSCLAFICDRLQP